MGKTVKKILCSLLVVVMCLTSAPLQGFVGLELPKISFCEFFSSKVSATDELAATGQCGDNVFWSFGSETGALIIFGEGDMFDYGAYTENPSPFLENDNIKSVIIDKGVTSIGNYAFAYCHSLTSIYMYDSVKIIGSHAFLDCDSLSDVAIGNGVTKICRQAFECCDDILDLYIPESVEMIDDSAFASCYSITNVSISEKLTYIGDRAFIACKNLVSIDIGSHVDTIGEEAFYRCESLERIVVDDNNSNYSSDKYGVLFNKDKTVLIQYPIGNKRTAYEIPDSVNTIGCGAFEFCSNIVNLYFGDNLKDISQDPFRKCKKLAYIKVGNENKYFSSDEYGLLFNKDKTTIVKYPMGNSRTAYNIPKSVKLIDDYAFRDCDNLIRIDISNSVASIGFDAFGNCDNLIKVNMGDSVEIINNYAFSECVSLLSIKIGDKVKNIGVEAFACCENLMNVTISKNVTTIGDWAFSGCISLKDIYYIGTEEQWETININENEELLNATIHYNSSGNELTDNLFLNHSTMTISNNICPNIYVDSYPEGITKDDIIWTSSNERVAYINGSNVNPIQYGKTLITASTKDGKYSASCELTVQSSFVITSTNSSLSSIKAGEEAEYSIMLLDYEGNKLPVENVTLSNESSKYLEILNHERTETEIKLTVKGLKAGTAVLEFGNDEPLTYNKFVFDVYPAKITYRADKVPVRDAELKTNFSRSGMFVENFRYYAVGEPAEYYKALMNVYNKSSSVGVVASYTQDGQLYDIAEVKKHQAMPTDYFEFLAVLGKGAVDIALLNTYNYRYSVESTKTEIEIKVPINGYLTVSNDIKSSPINFVYGMISLAVETAFQLAEDLTSIDGDKKSTVAKNLTKEVTDYFSKNTDHFDKLIKELSKDVIKNTSKMNIVSMGNYSLDVVSAIFAAMQKDFDDAFNSALEEVIKDSAHTFIKMAMMKDFINNKAIDKVTGGYIKAGEIMFSAAEHFNIVAEIIDISHSANSGVTTVTFGKCDEDGFVCKDTIKVNLKEEKEVLDAIYLQHYQIYIDKNQLTLRPEIKDLNLKENSVVEVHEITVMRDGVPYEIKQEVSVEVDIPDGWAMFNFKIYRVEPDGKLTDMCATVANGKAYFTTDHFSEYIFVGELEEMHTHSYSSATVNPTCTETGSITYTCYCGDTYTETIPATGHSFDGSECTNCDYDKADECDCNCHASGIKKFFFKLILFFQKLFKKNAVCACGVAHY